jgi:tRNA (adenine57-N1/adenine58-N1)-methyltransferase
MNLEQQPSRCAASAAAFKSLALDSDQRITAAQVRRVTAFAPQLFLTMSSSSPFFHPPPTALSDSLAILYLKRDSLLPLTLRSEADDGYAEGAVTNTRFGSFPHSTLIDTPWGSQVRASKVDTGTRGRKGKQQPSASSERPVNATPTAAIVTAAASEEPSKKRKQEEQIHIAAGVPAKKPKTSQTQSRGADPPPNASVPREAGSGFVHILPPTPEAWTASLDHRTQVVYTPDYSYVLQRLRVRPGDSMIEAGAGSGSFTHAAARAVFNGYPQDASMHVDQRKKLGHIFSYEFHEPRIEILHNELVEHGLDRMVTLTHRDVCEAGFARELDPKPSVTAIFLDLPAPWLALKHLARDAPNTPLDPEQPVHICTFSPCIEQVMATVSALRRAGWLGISMVEVQNRRIDVRRERVGLKEEGLRGVNANAGSVDEAMARLREIDVKFADHHRNSREPGWSDETVVDAKISTASADEVTPKISSKQQRLQRNKREAEERKLYKEGNVVHRTEPEVRTHTSYLVFAVLPRAWSEADEARCVSKWEVNAIAPGSNGSKN